jgi:hypothetical protein
MGKVISFTAFYTQDLRQTIGSLSHKALRMYVLLATYADRGGKCWPGLEELMECSRMGSDSVIDGLRELEELGLITYARRNQRDPITGKMMRNVYIVSGCLMRATDSSNAPLSEHEPIPDFVLKTGTTNEVTNTNNQESKNQRQAPPPLTSKKRLEEQKQAGGGADYATQGQKTKTRAKAKLDNESAAGTAPQNSKAPLPPYPPLPDGFDADVEMLDPDNEGAARWLCAEAKTVTADGGHYTAALSMANARRYIARFDRWRIRAALTLARRDPATRSIVGRMDYLLRTSVADEAQAVRDEMSRLYGDDAQAGD